MGTFTIDFFELSFLAEACIPPRPIARAMFWQNLTDRYWEKMSEGERMNMFEWLNRNDFYKESLEKEEDTQIFHARFNPDNQYMVKTNFDGQEKEYRAFKLGEKFYIGTTTFIAEEYILESIKFIPIREY